MKQKNIGATALLTLETQILTLKETILCLEPMIKEEESLSGSQGAPERKALTAVGCEGSFASEGVAFEKKGVIAQFGRALALHASGYVFKSR